MTKPNELDQINPFAEMEREPEEQYVEVFSETFTISAEDVKKMKEEYRRKPKITQDGDVEMVLDAYLMGALEPCGRDVVKVLNDADYVIVRQSPTEE